MRMPRGSHLRVAGHDLLLGLGMALGLAPIGLWPIALLAMGLALRKIASETRPEAAFRRGLFIGAGYFGFALSWIVQPFFVDPWRHAWLAPFAFLGVAFGFALFWALASWGARRLGGGVMLLAVSLAAAELLRGHILTGFPWALLGHIWAESWLAQMASLVGTYGMTLLTLLAVAAPLAFRARGLILTALIAALALGWSWHRLALPEPAPRAGIVRLVQPNISQSLKWDPDEARKNFDTLLRLTAAPGADLVIWPETAVPYLINEGEGAALAMAEAAGAAQLAVGLQRDAEALAWNSLAVISPEGFITQSYDKMHLVPFGEYIPMGDLAYRWFGLRAFASQLGAGYSPGEARSLIGFGADLGQALPLICYEAIFPEELVAPARADWILQITNDAWFGTLTGPYQHFDQIRLRAIEQGLPLLRAANTGISAFVDARGRVVEKGGQPLLLGLGIEGVVEGQIPGALGITPYQRIGDWPLAFLLMAVLAFAALRRYRSARA